MSARGPDALCRHCGLSAASAGDYCCYGCELAAQIAQEGKQKQSELYGVITFSLLLSMIVMMLSLFLFAEDVYGAGAEAGLGWMRRVYRVASALLSTPVVLLLGVPLGRRALAAVKARKLSMDQLVLAGAVAAYGLSIAAVLRNKGGVYFDSATSALVLTTLGRYLEASARARASRVIAPSLKLSSAPVLAAREGGTFERLSPAAIEPGMTLKILAEEVLPVDAKVIEGDAELTLGVITGAAAPVTRKVGEEVPAGAVPVSSALLCVALRPARESTLERLSALAKSLKERPSRLQRLGDTFAAALVPVVSLLALGSFAFTAVRSSFEPAVITSLSVVLAACPCTYGVATPLVLWLALRRALEKGVCIRNASALEELAEVKAVAFDKTGTLTNPDLSVLGAELAEGVTPDEVAAAVLALEASKRHPIARALSTWAGTHCSTPVSLVDTKILVGRGVSGQDTEGHTYLLGAPAWLLAEDVRGLDARAPEQEDARAVLARDGQMLCRFLVGEALRPEAEAALQSLQADGLSALMLTGDSIGGAQSIAARLSMEAHAALSPVDKLDKLNALGKTVAMVGDGLNDAPALAGTGPSFAMHGGTDLAKGMAQVTLLRPDLRLVPWTLALSRRAMQVGWQNLWASTIYNVLFLALAASGTLRPVWAGLSMLTSSLLTLASSLRVSAVPGPEGEEPEAPGREIPGFEREPLPERADKLNGVTDASNTAEVKA
ncbi:MAG: cation-translocating P-type ATPase [Byssovorax sp.]